MEQLTKVERFLDRYLFKTERPDFGQSPNLTNLYGQNWRFTGWGRNFQGLPWGSGINYAQEVGPLDESSLVMAVCNDSGIQLSEAKPSVRRKDNSNKYQPEPEHPLSALISNPNPFYIWEDYCLAGAFSWWANGNWYLQKIRNDQTGQVVELWYLPHFLVKPRWPNDGLAPTVPLFDDAGPSDPFLSHYEYAIPGRAKVLIPRRDMLHFRRGVNLSNPRIGIGAFDSVIAEIYGDKKAALFAATVLRNMGIVVPILGPKDPSVTFSDEEAIALKEKWMQQTTGDNSGMPIVAKVAIEPSKFAWNPTELDLKELRMIPESRIAAVTRYPAAYLQFLVGLKNGTSYASYKEAREQAYESVIVPIQNGIARRITQQLMPEFETTPGAELFFDTSDVRVLQEDKDGLMKRATVGYLGGIAMRSEARNLVGLESTPDDDVFFEPRGSGVVREGEDPLAASTTLAPGKTQPKGFGSVAEIEQYLGHLETQMKDFDAR